MYKAGKEHVMNRSQYAMALLVLAVFGFLGGVVSGRILPGRAEASNEAVITARALIIQDEAGNNLVTIGSQKEGCATITMQDPEKKSGIMLGFDQNKPLIRISGGEDLTTDIYPKGCTIFDNMGPVAIFAVNVDGDPGISFFRNKKPVASFGRVADGGVQLTLLDQITQNAAILGYARAGEKVKLLFTNLQTGGRYWEAP